MDANLDMNSNKITEVTDPTANQDAATKKYVDDNSSPTGAIIMYGAAAAPTGWLNCDGTAVNRTTYAALFTIIGETYGVGDGSTTFNLPNFASKFPRGNTAGSTGGADTHTLSVAEMPSHSHSNNVPGRLMSYIASGGSAQLVAGTNELISPLSSYTIGTSGSGNSHNNIPAYLGVNFIIKI